MHYPVLTVCYLAELIYFNFLIFYNCTVLMGFLLWEIWVAFPRESQLQQNCATQSAVHTGCFSVSTIHKIFNIHTNLNAYNCTGVCGDTLRESPLKVDWEKSPLPHLGIELRLQHAGLRLYQLSYIPTLVVK